MVKATITKEFGFWHVHYLSAGHTKCSAFMFPDGAFAFWLQLERIYMREQKAWAKIYKLNIRLLNTYDSTFIQKLLKTKCINITKRQYGYLSGIYERQQI